MPKTILPLCLLVLLSASGWAQKTAYKPATITEETRVLKTYAFGDPNPAPVLGNNPKIYPYHKFEGYSHEGKDKAWKVVKLENQFIELYVLPETGGKVWGAIEKSTGQEFIYRNEVMKFRNIAMRGPWTSGGIEFNFGIIGHTPATATPVDYLVRRNPDSSVTCIIGNIDLPSRTQWRVWIHLPKDKAWFETRAFWYNPTPLTQSYYNWMTAAAAAKSDLEFFVPGNQYLEHPGNPHPWPVDERGRKISKYAQNNFSSHKSYHVAGQYNDFFGGYYRQSRFGFGHWATYDDMPGHKLWLWSLSRSGGIWEDLLTDTDGQYIEFQAGRLFNQYSPGGQRNPITQVPFAPYAADKWRELWFPVKEIGGLTDVSPSGVLHVQQEAGSLTLGINALSAIDGVLEVNIGGRAVFNQKIQLPPMGVFTKTIPWNGQDKAEIQLLAAGLQWNSEQEKTNQLERPFTSPALPRLPQPEQLYNAGMELLEYREYAAARQQLEQCLNLDPNHQRALTAIGELAYRQGNYDQALAYARRALEWDTYNPQANYLAGIAYRAMGRLPQALEALGWAARDMGLRSAAYAQMGEIQLQLGQWESARHYAQLAVDYNRYNIPAWQVLAIAARKNKQVVLARQHLNEILELDPLCHFARFEQYLLQPDEKTAAAFAGMIRSEFPYQAYLELAVSYANCGLMEEARQVLERSPQHPLVQIWRSWLTRDQAPDNAAMLLQKALEQSPAFVFPFRLETIPVLEWAARQTPHWKTRYYLALNYWSAGRLPEAAQLMTDCGDQPDFAAFYLSRAQLLQQASHQDSRSDLERAHALDPADWRTWDQLIQYYTRNQLTAEAIALAEKGLAAFPDNYSIGIDLVRALNQGNQFRRSLELLPKIKVLPFEMASESRVLSEQAHAGVALELIRSKQYQEALKILAASREWPEHLGVGQPYDPDERLLDYLTAKCYEGLGDKNQSAAFAEKVAAYTRQFPSEEGFAATLALDILTKAGKREAAESLARELEKANGSAPMQWAIARYRGDQAALARLQMAPGNQGLFSLSFRQILAALEL